MAVQDINPRPLPGCGERCRPFAHDPYAHEAHGLGMALLCQRVPAQIVRTGPLAIDIDARRVTVNGRVVSLPQREWHVLLFLASPAGRMRSNEEISLAVFGDAWLEPFQTHGRRNVARSVYAHINVVVSRLRQALGEAGRLVVTIRGRDGTGGRRLELEEPR